MHVVNLEKFFKFSLLCELSVVIETRTQSYLETVEHL